MSLTIKDVNHAVELSFSGDLNIYSIAAIKEQVQKALEFATRVSLDLRDIEEIDTSGLQLLVALKKEMNARDIQLDVIHLGAAITPIFSLCEFERSFGLTSYVR